MTWFVDEYLDKTVRNLNLCPGVNIHMDTDDIEAGIYIHISVFWSKPRLNLDWYPIVNIEVNNKTIFARDGAENPDLWGGLLTAAADRLADAMNGNNKNA